ncbi:hypothetical protein Slin15195_G041400 [Septoria linicola]|uniref:Uncharacterized protein n=1 Tax=Septoria linicola TaxID=215465 RepID=A0A9Q9EGH3_9PEZI|nr:hypothetical protein Slin14017_G044920 [Septoria linicola]USW50821.1 hypothetical protein Slin15195_G041400 [Septoria linicola]
MRLFDLPPSLLLLMPSYLVLSEAHPEPGSVKSPQKNAKQSNATAPFFSAANGTGAAYATACVNAYSSYSSAEASWDAIHNTIETSTALLGGTSFAHLTYYENATTLCDGHPRVTYSPAISLSDSWTTMTGPITATSTYTNTMGRIFQAPSPSCTIDPVDCDGIWADYSESVAAAATITPAPEIQTPFCMNQTAASSWSSVTEKIYGCGLCTIYGEGVELVYFPVPTTVSRDMCAATPSASLTSYGTGAVLEAYAGKSYGANATAVAGGPRTAVVDGHTFTTGTAYISISKVYAVDRCSNTFGTVVSDAILAMPSESVLSLRYSQDHFQRLMSTDRITGYPVSYADFNTPIPWSAWIGQNQCLNQLDTYRCGVIYESSFRPQLAIPPEITSLSPDFVGCQMWYNGLWDPPLALTEAEHAAGPTLPGGYGPKTTAAAQPSQTPVAPTSQPTAIANDLPSTKAETHRGEGSTLPWYTGPTLPANNKPSSVQASSAASANGPAASPQTYGENVDSQRPGTANHPAKTADGDDAHNSADAGNGGNGASSSRGGVRAKSSYIPTAEPWTKDFTIGGSKYVAKAGNREAVIGTVTCVVNGPAQTLSDGTVCSYGDAGLTFDIKTSVVFDASATARGTTHASGNTGAGSNSSPQHSPSSGASAVILESDSQGQTEPNSEAHSNSGANPTQTGDADTATITIGGEVETLVQNKDGGPIILDGSVTLTPGGEATTLPDGYYISVATDGGGLVVGSTGTLGVELTDTGADNSVSGAIRSGIGYGDDNNSASSTSSNDATRTGEARASQTGAAANLVSFEILNFVTVVAFLLAAVVI